MKREIDRSHGMACAVACAALALLIQGCAVFTTAPRKACLTFTVADTLNLYDGQPHRLTVFIYPL